MPMAEQLACSLQVNASIPSFISTWVQTHNAEAQALGKPLIIEEFGKQLPSNHSAQQIATIRDPVFADVYGAVDGAGNNTQVGYVHNNSRVTLLSQRKYVSWTSLNKHDLPHCCSRYHHQHRHHVYHRHKRIITVTEVDHHTSLQVVLMLSTITHKQTGCDVVVSATWHA